MVSDQIPYFTRTKMNTPFQWEVTGGEIISGQGTYHIMVLWTEPGVGMVTVVAKDPEEEISITPVFIHPGK